MPPPDTVDDRDPCLLVADAEWATRIWTAVQRLPSQQRRLIRLVYRDGFNIVEAGHRIGLNGSSRKVRREALAALAVLLRTPTC